MAEGAFPAGSRTWARSSPASCRSLRSPRRRPACGGTWPTWTAAPTTHPPAPDPDSSWPPNCRQSRWGWTGWTLCGCDCGAWQLPEWAWPRCYFSSENFWASATERRKGTLVKKKKVVTSWVLGRTSFRYAFLRTPFSSIRPFPLPHCYELSAIFLNSSSSHRKRDRLSWLHKNPLLARGASEES